MIWCHSMYTHTYRIELIIIITTKSQNATQSQLKRNENVHTLLFSSSHQFLFFNLRYNKKHEEKKYIYNTPSLNDWMQDSWMVWLLACRSRHNVRKHTHILYINLVRYAIASHPMCAVRSSENHQLCSDVEKSQVFQRCAQQNAMFLSNKRTAWCFTTYIRVEILILILFQSCTFLVAIRSNGRSVVALSLLLLLLL